MCPNCRAFITVNDRVCPYCEMKVGPKAIEQRQPQQILGGLIPPARFTTIVILLINVALYAATALYSHNSSPDNRTLVAFGAKLPYPFMKGTGEWWRLVTANYLHGGLLHIGMNMWVLFDVGAEVEVVFGTSRFLIFYFITGVCGFLLSAFLSPGISIGASAALFGLIGAMLAFGITEKSALGAAVKSLYIRWAIYALALGLFFPGIDMAAHIGGLASGFICGYLLRTPTARTMWREPLIKGAAAVCVFLTLASFALMFRFFIAATR